RFEGRVFTDTRFIDIQFGELLFMLRRDLAPASLDTYIEIFRDQALTKTELELSKIENQINHLSKSISHVKRSIYSRMDKISHFPSIKPIRKGWISSTFGKRKDPFTNKIVDHPGIDICTEIGTKVVATGAGKVVAIRKDFIKNKGYGKFILIDHGFGYRTLYAHLSKILVKKGQKVKRWDIIGLTGNSGKSTSPHIHYGVFYNKTPHNPFNFILE
ncbi:MAG: M23 family metallopeptidase, partial [bacterium]